jgi:hypothetical protein
VNENDYTKIKVMPYTSKLGAEIKDKRVSYSSAIQSYLSRFLCI